MHGHVAAVTRGLVGQLQIIT